MPQTQKASHPGGFFEESGAGEGNRTLVVSLEGFCSTIELHPLDFAPPCKPLGAGFRLVLFRRIVLLLRLFSHPWRRSHGWIAFPNRAAVDPPPVLPSLPETRWWRGLDSNQRRRTPTGLQPVPFNHSGTPPEKVLSTSQDKFP